MNNLDKEYTMLLEYILDNGVEKTDRTGTGTLSIFSWNIKHDMSKGFPLLTTKKMYWKGIVTELLWFLRGDTNIKYLVDNDCHIWDGDANKKYADSHTIPGNPNGRTLGEQLDSVIPIEHSKEQFIERIKTDDEFAKKWGDLGPVYGKQWRSWRTIDDSEMRIHTYETDQIKNLIEQLKTNPDSRRLMVSAWNVGELDQMTLPPCHWAFEFYTEELTNEERAKLMDKELGIEGDRLLSHLSESMESRNIPTRRLSLKWHQRSVDTFLGLPFNIASYGLLLEMIAKEVNMVPGMLEGALTNVHLYKNHIEQAKKQIGRERGFAIKTYSLPTINFNTEHWDRPLLDLISSEDFCKCLLEEDIQLSNYHSHPTIKAPLNN